MENCDWKHGIRLVDPGCLQQAATETILSVCLCGSGGGFGFLKIFVHHNSPWNVKPALSPRRRGPSQLAVRILPRAFLVFIFRQHEIWPTLVFTKEQTGAVWPWRILVCWLGFFYCLLIHFSWHEEKASNSHFTICDFSKLWLKFAWQQDGNLAYDVVSLPPGQRNSRWSRYENKGGY